MHLILLLTYLISFGVIYLKYRDFFRFEIISIGTFGLIFIIPILNQETELEWVSSQNFVFLILKILIVFSFLLLSTFSINNKTSLYIPRRRWLSITFYLLTGIFIFLILEKLKTYNYNILNLVITNRVNEYLEGAKESSNLIGKIKSNLLIIYGMLAFFHWRCQKKTKAILSYLLILLYLLVTSHTRFIILTYLVLPLFYFNEHIKKVSFKVIIIGIFLSAMFLSYANYVRTGVTKDFDITETSSILAKQIEISSVDDFFNIYKKIQSERLDYDYGIQYLYYNPLSIIPRFIWSEKPIVSYFWRLTRIITGSYPGKNNFVLTSTLFGEAYHQGGLLVISIASFLYILIARSYISFVNSIHGGEIFKWIFLIHVPMDLRGSLSSVIINIIFSMLVLIILRKFLFKKTII